MTAADQDLVDVREMTLPGGGRVVIVDAGPRGSTRIVPPGGDEYAYERDEWARRVEVSVSPAGRSVRIFVDGQEVKP